MDVLRGIKVWMAQEDLNARKIAKKYGGSDSFICLFLKKERTSHKFVEYLIKQGCPAEYFKNGRIAA